ncbi:MAG TPA: hypothetical protein DDZ53_05350 [Firmicutes bacterium]|nr:hypothetical protein [Bacillota bacterium]
MRKEIPIALSFLAGIIMLIDSFTPGNFAPRVELSKWLIIMSAFMVGIASVNLVRIHGANVISRRKGWFNSFSLLVMLVAFTYVGVMKYSYPEVETWKVLFQNFYDYIMSPPAAVMYAIIAFYVSSASYRAFKARSVEATVLLVAAVVVMLGKAPVGELIWSKFPVISSWLLNVANTTGQRGIMIGAAIGGFVTSLRVLLGLERGHLGGV